jgi:hypothetical protein
MLKIAAIALAVLGLAAALNAARLWWKASMVPIPSTTVSISDVPELHLLNTQVAFNTSSQINSRAAIWTGLSALLSATASVLGVL